MAKPPIESKILSNELNEREALFISTELGKNFHPLAVEKAPCIKAGITPEVPTITAVLYFLIKSRNKQTDRTAKIPSYLTEESKKAIKEIFTTPDFPHLSRPIRSDAKYKNTAVSKICKTCSMAIKVKAGSEIENTKRFTAKKVAVRFMVLCRKLKAKIINNTPNAILRTSGSQMLLPITKYKDDNSNVQRGDEEQKECVFPLTPHTPLPAKFRAKAMCMYVSSRG